MAQPTVVIPVHKQQLTVAESASLSQVVRILGAFPIHLVAPASLNLKDYLRVSPKLRCVRMSDACFENFRTHQRMMISRDFYQRFSDFSHLLIYHLDAWVFRDELLQWCESTYDYIGAPWRSGFDQSGEPIFHSAGNGGFSLRRVETHIKTLSQFNQRRYRSITQLVREFRHRTGISRLRHVLTLPLKILGVGNSLRRFHATFPYTEDKFWAFSAGLANAEFRVAPVDVARRFAFEASPAWLFESCGRVLPFGCHAWRYEQEFWCDTIGLPRDLDFHPHNEDGVAITTP